jgi:AbrB family looped-hinge helix DNA binding protein
MNEAIVSTKGWVVIPKVYRQKYNLRPGSRVQIVDYGAGLSIVPLPDNPVDALQGLLARGPSLTADLLAERRKEREKEERRLE